MPVPTSINDLSQTAGGNFPPGTEYPSSLNDVQQAHASFIALLRDGKGFKTGVALASSATTDIGGQNSFFVEISGTTTITSFGTNYNGPRYLRFTDALQLTHNATTLILPGAANITTAAGDSCIVVPTQAGTGWAVVAYQKASLAPGVATSATTATTVTGTVANGVTAVTQSPGDNSTKLATTAYADRAYYAYSLDASNISVDSIPTVLNLSVPVINVGDALIGNSFNVPHSGNLRVSLSNISYTGTSASVAFGVLKNGVTVNPTHYVIGVDVRSSFHVILGVSAGDTVQIYAYRQSSSTAYVTGVGAFFEMM